MDLKVYLVKSQNDVSWFSDVIDPDNILSTDVYNVTRFISDLSLFEEKKHLKFDAILTFDEHLVLQTSVIAQTFACQATPIYTITHSSTNKLLFRKKYNQISSLNLIKVNFDVVCSGNDIKITPSTIDRIIKPLFGNNSYGVKKISSNENIEQLMTYLKKFWSNLQEECYKNFNDVFLIEDYVKGRTFSVDGIVQNKKIYFAGINEFGYGPEPYFLQVSNTIPPNITPKQESLCYKEVSKVLRQLRYNNTPFHAEVKLYDNKLFVIEIATRAPGGQIMKGYEQAYGFNFVKQVVNLYLNKQVDFKRTKNKFVYQKGVFIYKDCRIKKRSIKEKCCFLIPF